MAYEFPTVTVTDEDRTSKRFQYYTESAIQGIKIIEALETDVLKLILTDKKLFEALRLYVGADTNPNWVTGRIAVTLYDREEIDEVELDRLSR